MKGQLLSSPSLVGNTTWVSSTTLGWRFDSGKTSLPHSMGKALEDWATWELIKDLGILIHPSSLGYSLSSASFFIRRIFSGLFGVGVVFFQIGQSALSWLLGGVRVWELSMTYPCEKPPPFSLSTQGCCFAKRKPTRHLLAISNIPVGMRALYEGLVTRSVPSAQRLRRHLSQEIRKSIFL